MYGLYACARWGWSYDHRHTPHADTRGRRKGVSTNPLGTHLGEKARRLQSSCSDGCGRAAAPSCKWAKNSRLPLGPSKGDTTAVRTPNPHSWAVVNTSHNTC